MAGTIISVASLIGGLILAYLLVSNPKGVLAIIQPTGAFVMGESKILQGR